MGQTQRAVRFSNTNMKFDFITEDMTIYLAPSGSGGSDDYDENSNSTPWLTITKAFDWLKDKRIQNDKTVTIQLADGEYTYTEGISANHPDGRNISIVGENIYDISINSIQSVGSEVDETDYSYKDIILNVSSVSNIEQGDFAYVYSTTGGTRPWGLLGVYEIVNVDVGNTRITIRWQYALNYTTGANSNPTGAVTGSIKIIKTKLNFSGNGIVVNNGSTLGEIGDMVLVGNYAGIGIYSENNGTIICKDYMAVTRFSVGYYSRYSSYIKAKYSVCTAFMNGGYSSFYGSNILCDYSIANNGGLNTSINSSGFEANSSSHMNCSNSYSRANYVWGYHSTSGSSMIAESSVGRYCDTAYRVIHASNLDISNCNASYNAIGIHASNYGYAYAVDLTVAGNTNLDYSPNLNTQGNEYGYINT